MARLIFRADTGEEMELILGEQSPEAIVGRHKTCAVRTANNTVSRQHAQVNWVDGSYQLIDLNSSNGTFFNGQRIREQWLEDGDVFQCGAFPVRFELEDHERFEQPANGEAEALPLEDDPDEVVDAEPELSGMYPVAEEVPGESDGIQFGEDEAEDAFEKPPLDDFSFPEPGESDLEADLPPLAPLVPETIKSTPIKVPPPPPVKLGHSPVFSPTEMPFVPPEFGDRVTSPAPPPALPLASNRGQFDEFNRQLELKDTQLREARDQLKLDDEQLELYRAEIAALTDKLAQQSDAGGSTEELAAATARAEALEQRVAERDTSLKAAQDRLRSLENQILRIQEGQPTERELTDLRAAKEERDRLWDEKEKVEGDLLSLKRQLEQARGDADAEAKQQIEALEAKALEANTHLEEARDEIARLENRVDELEVRPTHDDLERADKHAAELEAQIASLTGDLAGLTKQRDQLEEKTKDRSEVEALEEKVAALKKQVRAAEEERNDVQHAKDDVERDLGRKTQVLERLTKENAELKQILAGMPDENTVRRLESERNGAIHDRDHLREEKDKLTAEITDLKDRVREAKRSADDRVESLETDLRDANKDRERLTAKATSLMSKVEELEDVLVSAPSRTQFDELRSQLKALEAERGALEGKANREELKGKDALEKLRQIEARAMDAEGQSSGAQRQLRDARAAVSTAEAERDKARAALATAEAERDRLKSESGSRASDLEARLASAEAERRALSSRAERADRVEGLEAELAAAKAAASKAQDELAAAQRAARSAAADSGKVKDLETSLSQLREEHEDLLNANKTQVKRISTLLKENEHLKDAQKSAGSEGDSAARALQAKLDKATADAEALQRKLDAAAKEQSDLAAEVKRLERETRRMEKAAESASAQSGEAEKLSRDLEAAQKAVKSLEAELEKAKAAAAAPSPAASARNRDLERALDRLIDDVNDRISQFKGNCETVQYSVEDVKNGVNAKENFATAMEMLQDSADQAEAIKTAIKTFRRDFPT